MSVAPICVSPKSYEQLPSLRELRLNRELWAQKTKVRAKVQHQLEVLQRNSQLSPNRLEIDHSGGSDDDRDSECAFRLTLDGLH